MASPKEELIKFIETLPNSITTDEILYQLYVREEIKKGKRDIREGWVYSEEDMDALVQQWQ